MTDTLTSTTTLSPWFAEHDPCHLALAWKRLGIAIAAVHHATDDLDGPIVASLEALRGQVWSDLWDRTTEAERDKAMAWAQAMIDGKPRPLR